MKLRSLDRRLVILVTIVAIAGRLALAAVHLEASHDRPERQPRRSGPPRLGGLRFCAAASGARGFAVAPVGDPRPSADTIEAAPTFAPGAPSLRLSLVSARARLRRSEPLARAPGACAPSALSGLEQSALPCAGSPGAGVGAGVLVEALVSNTCTHPGASCGRPAARGSARRAGGVGALRAGDLQRPASPSGIQPWSTLRSRSACRPGCWSGSRSRARPAAAGADGDSDAHLPRTGWTGAGG